MTSNLPLAGLRVVTAAEQYPGPYATMLLADLGADVVIVERPGAGDPTRLFPAFHAALNRGKRSVALDLKTEQGRAGLRRLLADADLFLEGFRPGTMARLGFDPDEVRALNPRTVYVSITGFGQTGPSRMRAAHDISYQAAAGLLDGHDPDRDPAGAGPEVALGDLSSALFAVVGALASLLHRQSSGTGTHVDVSMTDALVSLMTGHLVPALNGRPAPELGSAEPAYGVFACADGEAISLSVAYEDWFWTPLCDLLALHDARDLPRPERIARREELRDRIAAAIRLRPRSEWAALLDEADIAWGPVLALGELADDPHYRARELFQEAPYRDGTTFRYVAQPLVLDGVRPGPTGGVPDVGEGNGDLLGA